MSVREPASRPCGSCPYRRDVPSGIWDESEYHRLHPYDRPTPEQPSSLFLCHQQDGRLCAGWVATHDMEHSLALRFAALTLPPAVVEAVLDYTTDVPVFASGLEACEHGLADVDRPASNAQRAIQRLERKRDRRASA